MPSLRKPKRITILGDDGKEYRYLVKGGEDLRLDQRIEQVESYFVASMALAHDMIDSVLNVAV